MSSTWCLKHRIKEQQHCFLTPAVTKCMGFIKGLSDSFVSLIQAALEALLTTCKIFACVLFPLLLILDWKGFSGGVIQISRATLFYTRGSCPKYYFFMCLSNFCPPRTKVLPAAFSPVIMMQACQLTSFSAQMFLKPQTSLLRELSVALESKLFIWSLEYKKNWNHRFQWVPTPWRLSASAYERDCFLLYLLSFRKFLH